MGRAGRYHFKSDLGYVTEARASRFPNVTHGEDSKLGTMAAFALFGQSRWTVASRRSRRALALTVTLKLGCTESNLILVVAVLAVNSSPPLLYTYVRKYHIHRIVSKVYCTLYIPLVT